MSSLDVLGVWALLHVHMARTGLSPGCLQAISDLGAVCPHPPNTHLQILGRDPTSGEFLSRQTACYPDALATKFAKYYFSITVQ